MKEIKNDDVFIVFDTDIIQHIAETNLNRELTKEELSSFEEVLLHKGLSEMDDFIYRCIKVAVENVKKEKKLSKKQNIIKPNK